MSRRYPILAGVLRRRRRGVAIWAAALASVCGMYTSLFPYMSGMDIEAMTASLPQGMMEALGYDDISTAAGYVGSATYGLVALALLLVFAIGGGAATIAGPEERGELELELTSPLPRSAIYGQRLAALWIQITVLVAVVFAVTFTLNLLQELGIPKGDMVAATVQLWLLIGFFGSVSLALGAALGRRAGALGGAAALAVLSWMFNALGPLIGLDWLAMISPIGWYMDTNPMTRGFHGADALLLVVASALTLAGGWWRFARRDLMT